MRESTRILVQVDKTVIKITGLSVRGLKINELEQLLQERLQSMVRIIGVSGSQIEMDVYGMEESDILRDSDIAAMERVQKIRAVPFDEIPPYHPGECRAERWVKRT